MCGVRAIDFFLFYLVEASDGDCKIWLSAYWDDIKNCCDITDEDIRRNVKFVTTKLDYFVTGGILVDNVNTHSLRSSDVVALAFSGYSDT